MSELDLHALAAAQSPILFLDVDGVLNTSQMPGKHALHPKLLRRLKFWCLRVSAKDNPSRLAPPGMD